LRDYSYKLYRPTFNPLTARYKYKPTWWWRRRRWWWWWWWHISVYMRL